MVVSFCCAKSPVLSTSMVVLFFLPYSCQKGANWSMAGGRQERKVSVTGPRLAAGASEGRSPVAQAIASRPRTPQSL